MRRSSESNKLVRTSRCGGATNKVKQDRQLLSCPPSLATRAVNLKGQIFHRNGDVAVVAISWYYKRRGIYA